MTTTMHTAAIEDQYRRIVAVLDGVDDQQLRTAALPSGWTPLGMLVHLGDGARFWCRQVMLGELADDAAADVDAPQEPFSASATLPAAAAVEDFCMITEEALAAVGSLPLDTPPAWWPEGAWGGWRLHSLHEILLHMLVEAACHAGHLDAARELIDGATFDYATGRPRQALPRP